MEYTDDYSFVRPLLAPGEFILWKGRPEEGNLVTAADWFMIPFSILWCGFAFFWEYNAITMGAPFFFCLFGLPFIFVGLYMTIGRFFHTAYLRKRTYYVITNRNIIRRRGNKTDMLSAATMPPAHTEIHKNGNATIRFGMPDPYRRRGGYQVNNTNVFTLENISQVAAVQQALANMER